MTTTRATSFRLSERIHARLVERARLEGIAVRSLLERLIDEGIDTVEHPGVLHRGRASARRAALAGGPDVWEVVAAMRYVEGSTADKIAVIAERLELPPGQLQLAVDYAAAHREQIESEIAENDAAEEDARAAARAREDLLAS